MWFKSYHQSFPIACTSSSDPLKNTFTIRLQPVEFDWRSDDDDEDAEVLELDGIVFESCSEDDDDEAWCFELELDGNAIDEDDFESFKLVPILVLLLLLMLEDELEINWIIFN